MNSWVAHAAACLLQSCQKPAQEAAASVWGFLLGYLQRKFSVAHITTSDTYEKGLPKAGGLADLRMGTMDKGGVLCTTDGCDMKDSPGYFGHVELAKPMYHCGFIKTVVRVLRCVSYHTSALLIDKVGRA